MLKPVLRGKPVLGPTAYLCQCQGSGTRGPRSPTPASQAPACRSRAAPVEAKPPFRRAPLLYGHVQRIGLSEKSGRHGNSSPYCNSFLILAALWLPLPSPGRPGSINALMRVVADIEKVQMQIRHRSPRKRALQFRLSTLPSASVSINLRWWAEIPSSENDQSPGPGTVVMNTRREVHGSRR